MIVLGIDPGSRRCGFGVVQRAGSRLLALDAGVLVPRGGPLWARFRAAQDAFFAARDAANQAIEQSYIPPGMKDYIREYFSQLEP